MVIVQTLSGKHNSVDQEQIQVIQHSVEKKSEITFVQCIGVVIDNSFLFCLS